MAVSDSVLESVPTATANGNGLAGLLSIGKVASATGLCIATLRRLDGHLPSYVLPSGHRRYRLAEVLTVLKRNGLMAGGAQEGEQFNGTDSVPICLVTRVSTAKDSQRTSLVNQKERLQQYVANQFGRVKTRLFWSERVASGLNLSHPKVIELVDLILSGKLDNGYLLCCFKDRLCRYGWELFERLCQLHGIQLRFIDELDRKSDTEELQQDLLAVLTSFTARANGSKTRKLYGVQIDESTASLIFDWRNQKLSTHRIAARLEAEGKHLDANGRPITHTVLYKFLKRHGSVGRKLAHLKTGADTSRATPTGDSLLAFIAERVLRNEVGPNGKPVFTVFKTFYSAYDAFCDDHGLIAHSRYVLPKMLRSSGFKLVTRRGYLGIYAAMRSDAKLTGVAEGQNCLAFSRLRKTQAPLARHPSQLGYASQNPGTPRRRRGTPQMAFPTA